MKYIDTRVPVSVFGVVLLLLWLAGMGQARAQDERWLQLKQVYFGDKVVISGNDVVSLEAPARAYDAATVPITVTAVERSRQISEVYLFVDQNPLPLAGIFRFTEEAGFWHILETRIRINEYTPVRVVALMSNGELHMSERFVKASGGCSAPALSDMDAAIARAGKMKLLLGQVDDAKDLPYSEAVIKISHPNNSGMQFDQVSRNYIPAFYVNKVSAKLDGVKILDVETNFSMSENPVIRIALEPGRKASKLLVAAVDSKGNQFEESTVMKSP